MDQLAIYQQKWSLEAPKRIATTPTSSVYLVERAGEPVVLKLLTETGIHDEQRGAIALCYFDGHGAVRLLDATDDAHLLEYAAGDDLIPMVEDGQDDDAARIIAEVVTRLHSVKNDPVPQELHTLRRRFRSLFERVKGDADATLVHGAQVAEKLLETEHNPVVLHGDIHHWNIRQSARGWLAIDPKGLFGERTYDLANALLNPVGMADVTQDEARFLRHAGIYAAALGVSLERMLAFAFAHACLSISWSIEDGQEYDDDFALARMMETHVG